MKRITWCMRSFDLELTEALTPVDNQPVDLYLLCHREHGPGQFRTQDLPISKWTLYHYSIESLFIDLIVFEAEILLW